MARVKFNIADQPHVRIPKKTSIGRRPKLSSMNKQKIVDRVSNIL
jgi:hypothetical protein